MKGDLHVRFCERLAGETPACLLGLVHFIFKEQNTNSLAFPLLSVILPCLMLYEKIGVTMELRFPIEVHNSPSNAGLSNTFVSWHRAQ